MKADDIVYKITVDDISKCMQEVDGDRHDPEEVAEVCRRLSGHICVPLLDLVEAAMGKDAFSEWQKKK